MDAHTVMEEWDVSPFDGGYDGLRDLRARGFSGAVEAGTTWLFVRDGDPLAVVRDLEIDPRPGEIEAFEDASGQAHEAPHPAAASLAAMLALDGDVRGQYYTEDTPLSTVHETLSGGGFTGYVELSENVLSGDYYVVYRDGDEDYLGVLGSSNRLITDDEAQSKAEGEVGIYSVVAVRLPDLEIPEAETTATDAVGGAATGAGTGAGAATGAGLDEAEESPSESRESAGVPDPDPESGAVGETGAGSVDAEAGPIDTEADSIDTEADHGDDGSDSNPTGADPVDVPSDADHATETGVETGTDTGAGAESDPATASSSVREGEPDREPETDAETDDAPPEGQGSMINDPRTSPESDPEPETGSTAESPRDELDDANVTGDAGDSPSDAGDAYVGGHAASNDSVMDGVTSHSVPSLDPERTNRGSSDGAESDDGSGSTAATGAAAGAAATGAGETESDAASTGGSGSAAEAEPSEGTRHPDDGRTDDGPADDGPTEDDPTEGDPADDGSESDSTSDERVEAVRQEYESRIEELQSELQSLREERDRLRRRVSELESGGAGGSTASGGSLSPAEALAGTSLFVREGTRGDATLEDAHAGRADQETLAANLRIEYHTQFDDDGVTVDGEPFESWLRASAPFQFVEWLVTELLFEIRSTGTKSALQHLYDAIPDVDRVGFDDVVTVGDGQEGREIAFDVVARNRMGEPLVVADIDEGRNPTEADALQPLIGDAEDVATEEESLVAAFSVTSSFFEPDALDVAREATSGSLLSREKYRSYVKLSRKNGFHLCLVESREESFHLAVPEL